MIGCYCATKRKGKRKNKLWEDVRALEGYWNKRKEEQIGILEQTGLQKEDADEEIAKFLVLDIHHVVLIRKLCEMVSIKKKDIKEQEKHNEIEELKAEFERVQEQRKHMLKSEVMDY
ncbi:hypothetical protein RhiirB3_440356 [Rhizophagus irregularis]|nr:hypothetical protein RhiirB3_440356 [Rhizophagus irregularis]